MPSSLHPENLSTWMADVERRLRAVEAGRGQRIVQHGNVVPPNLFIPVTELGVVGIAAWECFVNQVEADSLYVRLVVTVAGETTGRIYLRATYEDAIVGQTSEAVVAAPAGPGKQFVVRFRWAPPPEAWVTGARLVRIEIMAFRQAGPVVNVYYPTIFMQMPTDATSAGGVADADGNPTVQELI